MEKALVDGKIGRREDCRQRGQLLCCNRPVDHGFAVQHGNPGSSVLYPVRKNSRNSSNVHHDNTGLTCCRSKRRLKRQLRVGGINDSCSSPFFSPEDSIRQSSIGDSSGRRNCLHRTWRVTPDGEIPKFGIGKRFDRDWRRFYNLVAVIVLTTCGISWTGMTTTIRSLAACDVPLARCPGAAAAV